MALWHFIKDGMGVSWDEGGTSVSEFDDGLAYLPDEDGFSRGAADAKARELGALAELTGVPGWHERIEREAREEAEREKAAQEAEQARQVKADAEAAIDAMLHPVKPETPEEAQRREINARFDALLDAAPDRATDIATLRKAALAEVG